MTNIVEVTLKIKETTTLKPDIIEKLTKSEKSFFRGAIDFYNNASPNERQPIDLTSAPCAHRFNDLVQFLEIGFSDNHSLFDYPKPDELFELAEYLGVLPDGSLDKLVYEKRPKPFVSNLKKEEKRLFDLARIVINTVEEDYCYYFPVNTTYGNIGFRRTLSGTSIASINVKEMGFEAGVIKLKEILNPRLCYMNLLPTWDYNIENNQIYLRLSLNSLK